MNGTQLKILAVPVMLVTFIASAYAGEGLGKTETEKLLSGNTIEGKNVRFNSAYTMYFDKSGDYRGEDTQSGKGSGSWRVSGEGDLCIQPVMKQREFCWTLKKRDSGYDMIAASGKVVRTIEKVLPGNPNNL